MFNHVLIPLAGPEVGEPGVAHGIAMAQMAGARVSVLYVLEQPTPVSFEHPIDPLEWHMKKLEAQSYLDTITERFRAADVAVERVLQEGQAAEHIISFAHRRGADLIVLDNCGQGGGSASASVQQVLQRSYTSVLLVRPGSSPNGEMSTPRYTSILVPLDCSKRAECVLPLVSLLAHFHEARLILVHIVSEPPLPRLTPPAEEDLALARQLTERNQQEAAQYLEQVRSRLGAGAEIRLQVGRNVLASLHRMTEEEGVDLVVLCAHGYTGEARWPYGSVATNFLSYGTVPLLLVQDLHVQSEANPRELVTAEQWGR